jgi:hypothetical protein
MLNKLKELEDQLKNKVDSDTFKNEVAALRELIGNTVPDEAENKTQIDPTTLANNTANQLNSQETKKLRELLDKFPSIEELIQKLLK